MLPFSVAEDLDAYFGLNRTTVLSQRDVPFMTRGVVPLLVNSGIQAITVGTNDACFPPQVWVIFSRRYYSVEIDSLKSKHAFKRSESPTSRALSLE